jgi:hypothetical protein
VRKEPDFTLATGTEAAILDELRRMRKDATRLNSSILEHLTCFQQEDDSFKTLPISKYRPDDPDISVGSTCTALMALLTTKKHTDLLSKAPGIPPKTKVDVAKLIKKLVSSKWESSGLPDGNAFTTALVVRTVGFVVLAGILKPEEVALLKHRRFSSENEKGEEIVDETVAGKSLQEIVNLKAQRGAESFAVSKYPAKTSIAYWFLDGAINTRIKLPLKSIRGIASWATHQFHQQLIYVSAGNDSLMDPPELAMAACLINRIHRLCNEQPARPEISRQPAVAEISRQLPSQVELRFAIERVLNVQPESGIWHKYFPLFHFPHGGGAADYCFSFEFLEAILTEFGPSMLGTRDLIEHFKRSLAWCDSHLLHFVKNRSQLYLGWNSGGEVGNLAAGMPESWATASVHMFLNQLHRSINELLDDLVLKRFGIDRTAVSQSQDKFKGMIDINIDFPNEPRTTLLTVLEKELLGNVESSIYLNEGKLDVPRSALFFGPPGTSKTKLANSIAEYLGWPIVIITPSNFLGRGLEQIHALVDEVFGDLMDLQNVVVFFDEMDALAQTREESLNEKSKESLDVTRQLLTTSMLPKLADVWDRAKVVFLMATNHKQHLDPAITRANRFDLILCVAPPPWSRKRSADKLAKILNVTNSSRVEKHLIRLVPETSSTEKLLDLFTVSEIGIFFDHLRRTQGVPKLADALSKYRSISEFARIVEEWAKDCISLREGEPTRKEFNKDIRESRRQYYLKEDPKRDKKKKQRKRPK